MSPHSAFTWDWGAQNQVLMLVETSTLTTDPSPEDQIKPFLIRVMAEQFMQLQ